MMKWLKQGTRRNNKSWPFHIFTKTIVNTQNTYDKVY